MEKNNLAMPFDVQDKIIEVREQFVLLDSDVAAIYGVETRVVNQAVKNNPDKFPEGYIFQLDKQEFADLKSKILTSSAHLRQRISTSNWGGTRKLPTAFTEKGLYMLATILKSKQATQATIAIVETYAKVRELKQSLMAMHKETDHTRQQSMMKSFSDALSDIVMPDLRTEETESTLELNFIIGKLKHTVKRRRRRDGEDEVEDE